MKNKIIKILFISLITLSFIPQVSFSATSTAPVNNELGYTGLVQCDGVTNTKTEPKRNVKCDFANLIKMANTLINVAFGLCIPIAIGLMAYSGFKYMLGTQESIKTAKSIMTNVVIGFVIALCAWFIVSTILKWVIKTEFKGYDTFINIPK